MAVRCGLVRYRRTIVDPAARTVTHLVIERGRVRRRRHSAQHHKKQVEELPPLDPAG
jgi:hypothetical protein